MLHFPGEEGLKASDKRAGFPGPRRDGEILKAFTPPSRLVTRQFWDGPPGRGRGRGRRGTPEGLAPEPARAGGSEVRAPSRSRAASRRGAPLVSWLVARGGTAAPGEPGLAAGGDSSRLPGGDGKSPGAVSAQRVSRVAAGGDVLFVWASARAGTWGRQGQGPAPGGGPADPRAPCCPLRQGTASSREPAGRVRCEAGAGSAPRGCAALRCRGVAKGAPSSGGQGEQGGSRGWASWEGPWAQGRPGAGCSPPLPRAVWGERAERGGAGPCAPHRRPALRSVPRSPVHRDPARHDGPRRGGRGDGLLLPGQRRPLLLARDPVVVRAQPQGLDGQTDVGFRPAKSIAAGRRWEGRDKNKCGEGGRQQHLAQAAPVAGEAHGRGHLRVPGDRLQRRQGPAPQGQGLPAGGPGAERRAAPPRPRLGPAAGHAAAGRPAGRARGPPAPPPQGRQGAQEALGGRLVPAVD